MSTLNRRHVLRGMLGGSAITVGLPLLDCFLNTNGTALASGQPIPSNFVMWFQGLAFAPGFWEPKKEGPGYDMAHNLRALTPIKDKVNIYSGLKAYLDGHAAGGHNGGPQCILQGGVDDVSQTRPSVDQLIADHIGTKTRFRSIEVACDGSQESYSRRNATANNPSEPSPAALYTRIFGPDFRDPNAADFKPDPQVMARRSVLSMVTEQRHDIERRIGTADKARIDEYFTALRELEQRLDLELQKPAPLEACSIPARGEPAMQGLVIDDAIVNHRIFSGLITHALACGQTQVANINFAGSQSNLRKAGMQQTFHMYTHEEMIDPVLGYQKEVEWFSNRVAETLLEFVRTLESIKEGDGTLLDRSLVMYATDLGYAKTHSRENIPLMTIGSAGGKIKTGVHVSAKADPVTRVGLTVMQAFGVPIGTWGTESNMTSKTIAQVMA